MSYVFDSQPKPFHTHIEIGAEFLECWVKPLDSKIPEPYGWYGALENYQDLRQFSGLCTNLDFVRMIIDLNAQGPDAYYFWKKQFHRERPGIINQGPLYDPVSDSCSCPIGSTFSKSKEYCEIKPLSFKELDYCPAQSGGQVGNPILTASGEKLLSQTDYESASSHSLSLTRHFRSSSIFGVTVGAGTAGLGLTWSHNHAVMLKQEGTASSTAKILFGEGNVRTFNWDAPTAAWKSTNSADTLSQSPAGFIYQRQDDNSTWRLNAAGNLLSQTQRNGWVTSYGYGNPAALGQLTQVTNQFGQSLRFNYDAAGLLTSVNFSDGQSAAYAYDSLARLVSVTQSNGSSGTVSKIYLYENAQFPQLLTGIIDESGNRLATYAYDTQGRGILTEHAGGADRHTISYPTSTGAPTNVTDPLGTQRTYSYSASFGKLAVTGASQPSASGTGDAASRIQDPSGFITKETDFLGVSTMYTWDISRRVPLSTSRAAGTAQAQTTQTQWHPTFRLPVLVTEAGRSTAYTYDALGNKLTETITDTATGQARTWGWTYNAQGLVATATAPNGGISRYSYDAQGNRTGMTNALGQASSMAYDLAGRMTRLTEPNGLVTSYTYDLRGRLLIEVRGGETTAYTYTPSGQLASATLPNGYRVSYSYDAAQRLISALDNRGNSVTYTLDGMGNRTREEVKDASGTIALVTSRTINSLNRVAAISGASGQTTAFSFDANGEAVSSTDPLNQTTRLALDPLRRPVSTTLPDNASASQAFNALDQLTQVTDPKGVATQYERNAFGEVVRETSPDMGQIAYTRDAMGDVIGQLDAKGNTTQINRDLLGRPLDVRYSADHIVRYTWDSNGTASGGQIGHLGKLTDNSGSTTYARDALGRITSKTQTVNDSPTVPSTYATRYAYAGGELASIAYPSGLRVYYRRGASGQITSIDTQLPGSNKPVTPFVTGLAYTALGQPMAWSWASGDTAARNFDADGRMTGNEFASYTFDAASRITGISQSLWASRVTTSTVNGVATTSTSYYPTPLVWAAGYDSRNRVISFTRNSAESRYSYDANSNRLSAVSKVTSDTDLDNDFDPLDTSNTSAQAVTIEASSNRQLGFMQIFTKVKGSKTLSSTTSPVSYSLDANGNLLTDGLRTFAYDASNRHSQTTVMKDGEASKITYLHNGLGQRVFKSEPQVAQTIPNEATLGTPFVDWLKTNFQWLFATAQANATLGQSYVYADGGASGLPSYALLGEYGNGGAASTGRIEYLYLPLDSGEAMPIGIFQSGKFYAVHTDHIHTPRLITDNANKPVWQWAYSAFGDNKPTGILTATTNTNNAYTQDPSSLARLQATTPALTYNPRYPGQYFDSESNLSYNIFRSYSATQGRYTQGDPIGLDGGLSRFGYVGGNALSMADPMGLQTVGPRGIPLPAPGIGLGAGGGGYDPRTDRFIPGGTVPPMPSWLKKIFTPKSALDQCEADCEAEKEERDALCFIAQAIGGKSAQRECLSRSDQIAYQCRKKCKEENCKP
jgi:RHS repeat-associated protein